MSHHWIRVPAFGSALIVAASFLAGCTSDTFSLDCRDDECRDFVFDALRLPETDEEAEELGFDFDGDGDKDNALGGILSALGGFDPNLGLNEAVAESVRHGRFLILLRVEGGDFENEEDAAAQAWLGARTECCPTTHDGDDPEACAAEALTQCFDGSGQFQISEETPEGALFRGSIVDGAGTFGPSETPVELPLREAGGILNIRLHFAMIQGVFEEDRIRDGLVAGAITQDDLDNDLLPQVAILLDDALMDDSLTEEEHEQISGLFDENDDGSVSLQEVQDNRLISSLLRPDVDANGDGERELSLGVGFTASPAQILDGET